jgi:hypothetical protein
LIVSFQSHTINWKQAVHHTCILIKHGNYWFFHPTTCEKEQSSLAPNNMERKIAKLHLPMNKMMYRSTRTFVVSCRTQITPMKIIKPEGEIRKYQNSNGILQHVQTIGSQTFYYENTYQYRALEVSTTWKAKRRKEKIFKMSYNTG